MAVLIKLYLNGVTRQTMNKILVKVLFIGCILVLVDTQIPAFGKCPKFKPMKDFDKIKFMGTWYENERYYALRDVIARCIFTTYDRFPDGKIYVNNYFTNRLSGLRENLSGKFSMVGKVGEALFNIRYNRFPFPKFNQTLSVLHTDYKSFSIIWTCRNLGQYGHAMSSWLMTRDIAPNESVIQSAYGILDKYELSDYFVKTDQTNCGSV